MMDGKILNSVFGLMVVGVFAEIRNRLECFCKCNIFVFQIWVKKNSVMFWYWGMFQYCSPDKSLQCCEQGGYRTYSHHCQIADKNPSKSWNGESWGFRICIGFVQRDFVFYGFFCARLISLSFPATTQRVTTPHRYLTATTSRATTPVQIQTS